ncbi:MAG TPA: sulfatase [Verrucomicrobiae bacterium]|nr:sulfatase [Verrucomicrobiae bacterium]
MSSNQSNITRRSFATQAARLAAAPLLASGPLIRRGFGAPAQRPNILYIMTDDHASQAISCYGSRVNQTPNLDRIAREGIRMDRVFATNSICTPSRATILTGKYSHMNGVPVFNRFDGSQPTVQTKLQQSGYYTAMVGKWHLGSDPTGFDYWNILPGQGVYNDPTLYDKDGSVVYKGYATDIITDITLDVLKNRPKDKPFFMMSHHKAPHREWTPDEKHRKQFEGKHIPEPPTLRDDYSGRTDALREQQQSVFRDLTRRDLKLIPPPGLSRADAQKWLSEKPTEVEAVVDGVNRKLTGKALEDWKYQRYMQDYLACVQSVDDNVGRVLDWLDANGLRENTVVIYTSDQGFFLGEHGLFDKRFMYEESLRMPFLVRWPGVIRPGSTSRAIGINCDFAPTFLDLAGQPTPGDMQGRSFLPIWKGNTPRDWRRAMYYRYYHDPGDHNTRAHYGIRTETHKLIYFWKKDQWECYDLVADPLEMHNIYNDPKAQKTVAALKEQLYRLKKELKDDDRFANEQPADSSYVQPPPLKKQ